MGFYSFGRIKIISRNGAKSAVATAAYHSATAIKNEYDGVQHDFSKKKNVGATFIKMPKGVPDSWIDENVPAKQRVGLIWNDVEQSNKSKNARLARSNYIALPHNLTLEQGLECVDRFIEENCISRGMGVTYSVHQQPNNLHVDLMYLVSEYDKNGKIKEKAKKEYLCRDKNGNELYMDAESFKNAEGYEKVYKYQKNGERIDMTPSESSEKEGWERINKYPVCRTIKISGWDEKDLAKKWRKSWEVILNEKYAELGMKDRVDCRSYKEMQSSLLPTIHEGWCRDKKERRAYNEKIRNYNNIQLVSGYKEVRAAILNIEQQIKDLQNNQTADSLNKHKNEYESNKQIIDIISNSEIFNRNQQAYLKNQLNELGEKINYLFNMHDKKIKLLSEITKEIELDQANQLEQPPKDKYYYSEWKNSRTNKPYRSNLFDENGRRRTLIELIFILAITVLTKEKGLWTANEIPADRRNEPIFAKTDTKIQNMIDSMYAAQEEGIATPKDIEIKLKQAGEEYGKAKKEFEKIKNALETKAELAIAADHFELAKKRYAKLKKLQEDMLLAQNQQYCYGPSYGEKEKAGLTQQIAKAEISNQELLNQKKVKIKDDLSR